MKKSLSLSQHEALKFLNVYLTPRVLLILLLGFSSGLPLALTATTLTIWMQDVGVDLTTIGLFSLVGLPYSLKFFWAPAVDAFNIPLLTKHLGRRRSWLLTSQLVLMLTIIILGRLDPLQSPMLIALAALCVATASATQDIIIDAYRVERLAPNEQAAGTAYYVSAYRVALLLSGAGVILLVFFLEQNGVSKTDVWFYGYLAASFGVGIGILGTVLGREPHLNNKQNQAPPPEAAKHKTISAISETSFNKFIRTTKDAFRDFLEIPAAVLVLLFIVFFKFCDALAGFMTGPFVLDIGFDKATYAGVVKGIGLIATLLGGFVGGFIAYQSRMYYNLWLAAILQMLSNLLFIWLAWLGPDYWALVLTITLENFAGGFGTVIFVAYISSLCHMPQHTATQFALLTALSSVGRTALSASSGILAETFGWALFFFITTLTAFPALALLIWMQKKKHFDYLHKKRMER